MKFHYNYCIKNPQSGHLSSYFIYFIKKLTKLKLIGCHIDGISQKTRNNMYKIPYSNKIDILMPEI